MTDENNIRVYFLITNLKSPLDFDEYKSAYFEVLSWIEEMNRKELTEMYDALISVDGLRCSIVRREKELNDERRTK